MGIRENLCQGFLLPEFDSIYINLALFFKGNSKLHMTIQTSMSYFHVLFLNSLFNGKFFVLNRSIVLVEKLEPKFGNISLS